MAQAVHAAFKFAKYRREILERWLDDSSYLVIVSVPDEDTLWDLAEAAFKRNISRVNWTEPDLDNELTAIALAPGQAAQQLCANLPLALREAAVP